MKKFLIFCFLIFVIGDTSSQNVTESLLNLRKSYSPLFSKSSSILSIDFVKKYSLHKVDTSFQLILTVKNTQLEASGFSVGTSIFSSNSIIGGSSSTSKSYEYQRNDGEMIFNYERFIDFYKCTASVYKFISERKMYSNSKINTVTICEFDPISIGAEYDPGKLADLKFYFKIGDKSVFQLSKIEFEEIMKLFSDIKKEWETSYSP